MMRVNLNVKTSPKIIPAVQTAFTERPGFGLHLESASFYISVCQLEILYLGVGPGILGFFPYIISQSIEGIVVVVGKLIQRKASFNRQVGFRGYYGATFPK
jgi:hypothetical protein